MWRVSLSIVLSVLITLPIESGQEPKPTVQETVSRIATGSIVEVKTKTKGMKKVRGRLGAVTAAGFEVQTAQGAKVDTVKLQFEDVKSVTEKPPARGSHPAVLILAGAGAALLVIVVIAAILARGS